MPEVQRTRQIELDYLQSVEYLSSGIDAYAVAGIEENEGRASLIIEDNSIPNRSTSVADTGWVKDNDEIEVHYDRGRVAIGISEILIGDSNYAESSSMITKPIQFTRKITRVRLTTDESIPDIFPTQTRWIVYEISFGDGDFIEISPENIGVIGETPVFLEPKSDTTTLRLKITLKRPSDKPKETPILKGYQLKVELTPA